MSAEDYYDKLNEHLASEARCLSEEECEALERESTQYEALEALALGAEEEERAQLKAAIEQEQIIEASRSVRAGTDMLFAALRNNGVFKP